VHRKILETTQSAQAVLANLFQSISATYETKSEEYKRCVIMRNMTLWMPLTATYEF